MTSIYIAAPLFNAAERRFNLEIADEISQNFDVFLPQRDGLLLEDLLKKGEDASVARRAIFSRDMEAIANCDVLLIVLNGATVDEGAAFELGVAYAMNKVCIGLQTDARRLLCSGNNPMIDEACTMILSTTEALSQSIAALTKTGLDDEAQ